MNNVSRIELSPEKFGEDIDNVCASLISTLLRANSQTQIKIWADCAGVRVIEYAIPEFYGVKLEWENE